MEVDDSGDSNSEVGDSGDSNLDADDGKSYDIRAAQLQRQPHRGGPG